MEHKEEDNPELTRVEDFSEPPDSAPPAAPPSDTLQDDSVAVPAGAAAAAGVALGAAAGSAAATSAAASSTSRTAAASSSAAARPETAEVAEPGAPDGAVASPDVVVDVAGKEEGVASPSPRGGVSYVDAIDGWAVLVGLLVTSTTVFIACLVDAVDATPTYGTGYLNWALAGSITSLTVTILLMALKQFAEHASIKAAPTASLILLVLWLAVSIPATFAAPFPDLGNGWLGCWTSVAASGALAFRALKDKARAVSDAVSTGSNATKCAMALGLSSVVLLIAAIFSYSGGTSGVSAGVKVCGGATGSGAYAISVGAISTACSMGIFVATLSESCNPQMNMGLSIFLALWWSVGAFVITFVGPFHSTGCSMNGYVSTWAALFSALALFKACGLDAVKECFSKMKGGSGKPRAEQRVADELPTL